MLYQELSKKIISAFFQVSKELGPGLLELPYHNALYLCLEKMGLRVRYHYPLPVYFEGEQVGDYFADLLIEDKIIIEVKAVQGLSNAHMAQLFNYLRISKCKVGFLVNFHYSRCEFRRAVV